MPLNRTKRARALLCIGNHDFVEPSKVVRRPPALKHTAVELQRIEAELREQHSALHHYRGAGSCALSSDAMPMPLWLPCEHAHTRRRHAPPSAEQIALQSGSACERMKLERTFTQASSCRIQSVTCSARPTAAVFVAAVVRHPDIVCVRARACVCARVRYGAVHLSACGVAPARICARQLAAHQNASMLSYFLLDTISSYILKYGGARPERLKNGFRSCLLGSSLHTMARGFARRMLCLLPCGRCAGPTHGHE